MPIDMGKFEKGAQPGYDQSDETVVGIVQVRGPIKEYGDRYPSRKFFTIVREEGEGGEDIKLMVHPEHFGKFAEGDRVSIGIKRGESGWGRVFKRFAVTVLEEQAGIPGDHLEFTAGYITVIKTNKKGGHYRWAHYPACEDDDSIERVYITEEALHEYLIEHKNLDKDDIIIEDEFTEIHDRYSYCRWDVYGTKTEDTFFVNRVVGIVPDVLEQETIVAELHELVYTDTAVYIWNELIHVEIPADQVPFEIGKFLQDRETKQRLKGTVEVTADLRLNGKWDHEERKDIRWRQPEGEIDVSWNVVDVSVIEEILNE